MRIYRIIISPSLLNNNIPRYNSRGPLFEAKYQGRVIVKDSTEPGLDSARVFRTRGHPGLLEIWDEVLPYWRFRLDIEKAAGLTVQEGERRPIYRKFKSFTGHRPVEGVSGKADGKMASAPKDRLLDSGMAVHSSKVAPDQMSNAKG